MTSLTLGILSDTHYPGSARSFPIEEIRCHFLGVDQILHAGDIVSEEVLAMLGAIAPVEAVAGNMDPSEITRYLPEKKVLVFGEIRIGLVHGSVALPAEDKLRYYFGREKLDVFVFGHTHRLFNERINGVLFFNPGSPAKPRDQEPPTVGILRLSDGLPEASIVPLNL